MQAMMTGYKFLLANYEDGDKLFLFGFSRGAYAARSLASMLAFPGLLARSRTSEMVDYASYLYQIHSRALAGGLDPMQTHCTEFGPHPESKPLATNYDYFRGFIRREPVGVDFLGVFDTVGALGPSGLRPGTRNHNMQLSPAVRIARHALAIDEHRLTFAPEIWRTPDPSLAEASDAYGEGTADESDVAADRERVMQVWFEGAHSDIGGGSATFNSLSNTTLLWMLSEANRHAGLEVDYTGALEPEIDLLRGDFGEHGSLKPRFRAIEAPRRLRNAAVRDPAFTGRLRNLKPTEDAWNIKVASSALRRYGGEPLFDVNGRDLNQLVPYRPGNLQTLERNAGQLDELEERVVFVPFDADGVQGRLRGVLDETFTHVHAQEAATAALKAERKARQAEMVERIADMHRRSAAMRELEAQVDAITVLRDR